MNILTVKALQKHILRKTHKLLSESIKNTNDGRNDYAYVKN